MTFQRETIELRELLFSPLNRKWLCLLARDISIYPFSAWGMRTNDIVFYSERKKKFHVIRSFYVKMICILHASCVIFDILEIFFCKFDNSIQSLSSNLILWKNWDIFDKPFKVQVNLVNSQLNRTKESIGWFQLVCCLFSFVSLRVLIMQYQLYIRPLNR